MDKPDNSISRIPRISTKIPHISGHKQFFELWLLTQFDTACNLVKAVKMLTDYEHSQACW